MLVVAVTVTAEGVAGGATVAVLKQLQADKRQYSSLSPLVADVRAARLPARLEARKAAEDAARKREGDEAKKKADADAKVIAAMQHFELSWLLVRSGQV